MYKMPFVKKTVLYALTLFLISLQTGYAQGPIKPALLLQNTKGHQFYSFENNTLSLYKISEDSEYFKIWEYNLLDSKEAELISILYGDIKGGPEQEIILVVHSFGSQGELYLFSVEQNIPKGSPEILSIPTRKEGTRPTQAQLINWDQQKKQEILLTCSSPERELLVLDYYNNNLSVIATLATDFLTSTYGPITLFTTDKNKDQIDDILIYSTKESPLEYALLSTQKEEQKTLSNEIIFSSIKHFSAPSQPQTLCLLNGNIIYSITKEAVIPINNKSISSVVDLSDQDIIIFTEHSHLINISTASNGEATIDQTLALWEQKAEIAYITDQNNKAALFYNLKDQQKKLVLLRPILTQQTLTPKKIEKDQEAKPLKQAQNNQTEKHDTLYVNVGGQVVIDIPQLDSLNIESVETHKKPTTMKLNPKTLEFVWAPKEEDKGIQKFEYSISYVSEPKLQQTTTPTQQLALKNTFTKATKTHQYHIYVNDVPILNINNPTDTIHITGFFESKYSIKDIYSFDKTKIQTAQTRPNNILINKETLYWEPDRLDAGEQIFTVIADDGMAQDTALISIFVDTTIQKQEKKTDFTITVNESFVHQLPYTTETKYNIVQGPDNLRISPKGTIYWVPIITQVDFNLVVIEATTAQKQIEHILNIYVNSPPVISYQPAKAETIAQGEKFQFQFQSFDMNTDATLRWANITNVDTSQFLINQFGMLEFDAINALDNFRYIINLSDKIDTDIFVGKLYVNAFPKIISIPEQHIQFGESYIYTIIAEDDNQEKPYQENKKNQLYYKMSIAPQGATFNSSQKTISWTPTKEEIGKNLFKIEVTDSIETAIQEFSVFVNDKPNIISPDSLSIMLGDTLFHYFDAQDLNQDSELLYTIKTTIDEILFSGKSGKLVWVPKEQDLGLHTLEINVSDGFNTGTDMQKLNIFVYKNPTLLTTPKEEAFVNMAYKFNPKGYDMFGDSLPNKDVFFNIASTDSLFSGQFDLQQNNLEWTPSLKEIGEHALTITVIDKRSHQSEYIYPVSVMLSPCETLKSPCEGADTLIINQTDTIEKTIVDSIFIEKKDTIYIDKKQKGQTNNRNEWKPKSLGF